MTRFIAAIPDQVVETRVLQGRIGQSIVTARRYADGTWAVGGMTNWDARDIDLSFSFLPEGQNFRAELMTDGRNAHHNAEDYQYQQARVTSTDTRSIHIAPGGGFAIVLKPDRTPASPFRRGRAGGFGPGSNNPQPSAGNQR